MVTRIKNARAFLNGKIENTDIYFEDRAICEKKAYECEIDACGNYVSAGFVDLHCHGGAGSDFCDGTADAIKNAAKVHLLHGTTTLFPTLTSVSFDAMERAISAIEEARGSVSNLGGIHLEGPYFSPAQTGAQNGGALRSPVPGEFDPILKKYNIARWDYAPELDGDFVFADALKANGVIAAAAHTDASCAEIERAAERGCRIITHLYSCTSTIKRENGFRIAGVVEAAYLVDDISVELIADGCHLPHELLRLAYKLKGADRIALVTDAMRAAGLGESGEYDIGGVKCFVEDGVAKLLDRSAFAGSVATADRLVRTCVSAGIPLADAIKMMTDTPARLMGLSNKGRLDAGCDADIVIFDDDINIKHVISMGECVL